MIKFALVCEDEHDFESWFPDGAAYETQVKRGQVTCPVCNSSRIGKAIMAPALLARRRTGPPPEPPIAPSGSAPEPAADEARPVALLDERQVALRAMMQHIRSKIVESTDDVGKRFPQEARKMHDGDIPTRSIRGEASIEDAKALIEDGIQILPMPILPEERN